MKIDKSAHKWIIDNMYNKSYLNRYGQYPIGIRFHLGIIDNGYRGDLGVKLYNFSDTNVTLNKGTKIAQLVLYPHITANVSWVEEVTEADRGDAGFGSTDKA